MKTKFLVQLCICLLAARQISAQKSENQQIKTLTERALPAPESIFTKFREAGMNPIDHPLTEIEKQKISKAFSSLPPLHQKILNEHLHSISFMDNMPNTALTSPVETSGSEKMFNITFRAEILKESISQWAIWKENSCYLKSENDEYEVTVDAGNMDAIVYILLHEATHVVDSVLNITSHPDEKGATITQTSFTKNIWQSINKPLDKFTNPILETTRFRSGKAISILLASDVYKNLQKTPFASLYSMASWHEDLAELLTIYHLTRKMGQPYKIQIKKNGITETAYEPFKNENVVNRQSELQRFYQR